MPFHFGEERSGIHKLNCHTIFRLKLIVRDIVFGANSNRHDQGPIPARRNCYKLLITSQMVQHLVSQTSDTAEIGPKSVRLTVVGRWVDGGRQTVTDLLLECTLVDVGTAKSCGEGVRRYRCFASRPCTGHIKFNMIAG
jgi:hypothetical protein